MKRTNAIKQILLITIIAILFLIPTIVKANETFTTPDGIVATKIVNNSAGNVEFKITNLNISEEGSYKWTINQKTHTILSLTHTRTNLLIHLHTHTFDKFIWNDQYYNTIASKY